MMLNRQHVGMKLMLDVLRIPVTQERYQEIGDVFLLARQRGVETYSNLEYDPKTGHAISPRPMFRGGPHDGPQTLWGELYELKMQLEAYGEEATGNWQLDGSTESKLRKLRRDIDEKGLNILLKEASKTAA